MRFSKIQLCLLIVSCLLFIRGIPNAPHPYPWQRSYTIPGNSILEIVHTDHGTWVLQPLSLTQLGKNGNLINEFDISKYSSTEYFAYSKMKTAPNGDLYFMAQGYVDNTVSQMSEHIFRVIVKDKKLINVYERQFLEKGNIDQGEIWDFCLEKDTIFITEERDNKCSVTAIPIDTEVAEEHPDQPAAVAPAFPSLISCAIEHDVVHAVYSPSNGVLTLQDCYGDIYEASQNNPTPKYLRNSIQHLQERIHYKDQIVTYSWLDWFDNLLYWLACAYLCAIACLTIARLFMQDFFSRNRKVLMLIGCVVFSAAFFVFYTIKQRTIEWKANLVDLGNVLAHMVENELAENTNLFSEKDALFQSTQTKDQRAFWEKLSDQLYRFSQDAGARHAISCAIIESEPESDMNFHVLANSSGEIIRGQLLNQPGFSFIGHEETTSIKIYGIEFYVTGNQFKDKQGRSITLYLGSAFVNLYLRLLQESIYLVLQFLSLLLTAYIIIESTETYVRDFEKFFQKRREHDPLPGVWLSNFSTFFVFFTLAIDTLLLVLAVKSICSDASTTQLAILVAIPMMSYRIASFVGSVITGPVVGRIGEKKATLISSIMTILAFVLMGVACQAKLIALLTIAKFLEGVFLESIFNTVNACLAFQVEDPAQRNKFVTRNGNAAASGGLVGLMAAGYLTQYLNFAAMYYSAAIISVVFVFISLVAFNSSPASTAAAEPGLPKPKTSYAIFLKGPMLKYTLLIIFPTVLLAQYGEFIYPLISEHCGVSSMVISSIGVLALAVSYLSGGIVEMFNSMPRIKILYVNLLACSICFLLVVLNDSFIWATIIYFISLILLRPISAHYTTYLSDLGTTLGGQSVEIQQRFGAIFDGLKCLTTPILSALCTFSLGFCTLCLGSVIAILPSAYFRKHTKKYGKNDPLDNLKQEECIE